MTPLLTSILLPTIGEIVRQVIRSPSNDVPPREAPAIAAEVVREVAKDPVIRDVVAKVEHATNAEPWYQSRVTIGALVTIGTGVAGLLGVVISPADAEAIVTVATGLGAVAGALITLYGRWVAKKPLGT